MEELIRRLAENLEKLAVMIDENSATICTITNLLIKNNIIDPNDFSEALKEVYSMRDSISEN